MGALTDLGKGFVKGLPFIRDLVQERDALAASQGIVPNGHFYSPITSLVEVRRDEHRIFGEIPRALAGIDMREDEQLRLLEEFSSYYASIPFRPTKTPGLRYFYENGAYSYSDAIILHCMIRHLRPRRIVEIGSGYSSCATLDTNALHFDNAIQTTFIDPYPQLLVSLLTEEDKARVSVIPERLQDVDLEHFRQLEEHDILFVDSTHVSKVGSDVNHIFFEILPLLNPGVHVHVHDIFYPFEYPKEWIYGGRSWNENYLLRAFLQFNSMFRIVFMNTFMEQFHEDFFREAMPLCLKNRGGSIWFYKL